MNSICDILIFKTVFEDENVFKQKHNKIKDMFEDYIINSWIDLKKTVFENEAYNFYSYENNNLKIKVIFSFKKNLSDKYDFLPSWMVNYHLDKQNFLKENIESFLNDNIKFIYNVFFSHFFIEYDVIYNINDYNKWKKLDLDNLPEFDNINKDSVDNKNLIDSMMHVYFSLYKNLFDINKNDDYLELIKSDKSILTEYKANLELFKNRTDIVKKDLLIKLQNVEAQLKAFINLIL